MHTADHERIAEVAAKKWAFGEYVPDAQDRKLITSVVLGSWGERIRVDLSLIHI